MSKKKVTKGLVISFTGLVCVLVTAILLGVTAQSSSSNAASAKQATVSGGKAAATCWEVHMDANEGNRVLSSGIPVQYRTSAQASMNYLLSVAKQDPTSLQAMWNVSAIGEKSPIVNWHTLVSGNCYSQQGQTTWRELAAQDQTQASVVDAQAPATGCNTFVVPGGNATCKVESIAGDRSGIQITYTNGQTLWVMYRCGNPVTNAPPPTVPPIKPPTTPPASTTTTTTTAPPHKPPCTCGATTTTTTVPPSTTTTTTPSTTTTTTCLCTKPIVPPTLSTGVDGPTPTAPTTPPDNTAPKPDNNTGTNQPAPASTPDGSNSGSTDGKTGVPSGSDTGGNGTTTTGSDTGTSAPTSVSAASGSNNPTPVSGTPPTPG